MIYKYRKESEELTVLRQLNLRLKLSEKDSHYFRSLEKGFIGEKMFDELVDNISCNWFIINDLFLEVNNSFIQIDKVIIASKKVLFLK